MARQRNYRAEYEARKLRARETGFTGYGSLRGFRAAQLRQIMTTDPAFTALPIEQQTKANAITYQNAYYYLGAGTSKQAKLRAKLKADLEGNLDVGVWSDYYKDVIYPALTGKAFPGWNPIVVTNRPVTMDEWDELMRADTIDTGEE